MLINSPNISGSLTVTGNSVISGSLNVLGSITGAITGSATTASYVEFANVADKPTLVSGSGQISFNGITDKPTLVSGSSQIEYSGLTGIPAGIVSGSAQITDFGIFATTGSNQFNGSQAITGSLTTTGTIVAQTLNVQQVTSSIVYSSGSNIFGNELSNTQQFTGSVGITGSLALTGTGTFSNSVGISRTPSSGFKLDIQGNEGLRILDNDVLRSIIITPPNSGATGVISTASGQGLSIQATNVAGNLTFETAGVERMRITSGGNVGIGTDSVSGTYEKLAVAGGISIKDNTNAKLEIGRYNTTGAQNSYIKLGANSNSLRFTNNTDVADIMELTNSGNLSVTGTVAMNSPFIFRNKVINGAMTIDQRNEGSAITTDGGYPVDRFVIYTGANANLTNQRSTIVPTGFKNSLSVTVGAGINTASGDYVTIRHGIEGLSIYDLAWGTASAKNITLSFWVRSSLTGNFGVALRNNANNYGYVASYNIPSANTWTYITATIPGPTIGTWNTDNNAGIRLIWDLGVGTQYSIAAGAWTSQSEILGLTGGVKLKETTGATFYITGIQFEVGDIATPFEHRPITVEELLCKRYYEKEVFTGGTYFVAPIAGTQTYATISYKAEKRANPQVALPQVSTASDSSNRNPISNGVHRGSWYATLGGSLTNNVNSFTFTAECEIS